MALDQEESLLSGIRFRNEFGVEERPGDEFDSLWDVARGMMKYPHDSNQGKADKGADDIADLLPRDPFDMDISATVTAITGWIEDFGLKNLGFESCSEDEDDHDEVQTADDHLLAELNIVWGSVHPDLSGRKTYKESSMPLIELEKGGFYEDDPLSLDSNLEAFMGFSYEKYWNPRDAVSRRKGWAVKSTTLSVPGPPPDALFFALGYLGVRDLLSVERVCKSLCDAVQNDPLLWRNFCVSFPLHHKITDDALLRLTNRAQGKLSCLNIVDCLKITNSGLRRVLEFNPGLTKLSVAGCLRLTIDGTLENLRFFRSVSKPGIRQLRIGSPSGLNSQHFEEFKLLLGDKNMSQGSAQNMRFFRAGQLYLSFDDERVFDIEPCPKCTNLRQIYDCPADSCRGIQEPSEVCRACTFCIARCINCGRCLNNRPFQETFCLDLLCLDCWNLVLNCQDRQKRMTISPKHSYLHQQASYHFFLYG